MNAPDFWSDGDSPLSRILAPLGWVYAQTTAWRLAHGHPWQAPISVICVGNLTAGGTGKTPVVRDLATRLAALGRNPAILSRGYGGRLRGPVRVAAAIHGARDVGDEPLLLASDTPCWVSADRAAGARAIVVSGAGTILMDDGLQNPSLVQNLKLVVADGAMGFGNGRAIPAGPLRERVSAGLARTDALIVIGEDAHGLEADFAGRLPVLRASLETSGADWLDGARLMAFAGIGRPGKFRATLAEAGAEIAEFHPFADHHSYSEAELDRLADRAEKLSAKPVTTEKDWVRLPPAWQAVIVPVRVAIAWRDAERLSSLLTQAQADV